MNGKSELNGDQNGDRLPEACAWRKSPRRGGKQCLLIETQPCVERPHDASFRAQTRRLDHAFNDNRALNPSAHRFDGVTRLLPMKSHWHRHAVPWPNRTTSSVAPVPIAKTGTISWSDSRSESRTSTVVAPRALRK